MTLFFFETAYANGNPFWNPLTSKTDFRYYCKINGFSKIDYLITLLSWNGAASDGGYGKINSIKRHTDYAKEFFRIFHKDYPDAKIKMLGLNIPSINGGTGENYGANHSYSDWYNLVLFVMGLNLSYQELANEDEFKTYVEFINISAQVDSEKNMASQEKNVNTRNNNKEMIGINGVHPDMPGYMQIADAVFRALVPEVTE